ncbi:MAG TPA: CBS domain-containing protein [Polyangiaceae bacterium]|jgi:CBS domain-containing protein|nr:CBS domain-containing protein [Polyangiaceae bacterium]
MRTVADVMTTHLYTCKSRETLDRAAKIMWEHSCSCVPVVDEHGFLVALVSDRDVCITAYTQRRALSEIMVTCAACGPLRVVHTVDSLDAAHELMRRHHVRCLPVVERTGRLIGILSITDIIRCTRLQSEPPLSADSVAALGSLSSELRG